jgi:hypothetical protein
VEVSESDVQSVLKTDKKYKNTFLASNTVIGSSLKWGDSAGGTDWNGVPWNDLRKV